MLLFKNKNQYNLYHVANVYSKFILCQGLPSLCKQIQSLSLDDLEPLFDHRSSVSNQPVLSSDGRMSSLSVVFRFITLPLLICSLQGWTISTPENLTKKINKCVDSLTKAVKFCSRRYRNFTIDSLYELAILRGK